MCGSDVGVLDGANLASKYKKMIISSSLMQVELFEQFMW